MFGIEADARFAFFEFKILDVSDLKQPRLIGQIDTPGSAENVEVINKTAFIADWTSGLQIVGASDPASPALIGARDAPGFAGDIEVVGGISRSRGMPLRVIFDHTGYGRWIKSRGQGILTEWAAHNGVQQNERDVAGVHVSSAETVMPGSGACISPV